MKSNTYSTNLYNPESNRTFLFNFAISIVFGEFTSIKEEFFGPCTPIKSHMHLILPSHLNLSGGICFTEITFKISTEKKKTNILVAKARNPWSNIETVPNL